MKQVFALAAVAVLGIGIQSRMTDHAGATKTLDDAGFKAIQAGGHAWFSCGEGDLWATKKWQR